MGTTKHYLLLKRGHGFDLAAIKSYAERLGDTKLLAWATAQEVRDSAPRFLSGATE